MFTRFRLLARVAAAALWATFTGGASAEFGSLNQVAEAAVEGELLKELRDLPGVSAPTIADDGTVYCSMTNRLLAFTPDLQAKWTFATDSVLTMPIVGDDGTVYAGASGGSLFAVRPDGSLSWKSSLGNFPTNAVAFSPALGPDGIILLGTDSGIGAFDSRGGLLWKNTVPNAMAPMTRRDVVYCSTDARGYGQLVALGADGTELWQAPGLVANALSADGLAFGVGASGIQCSGSDGVLRWQFFDGGFPSTAPVAGPNGSIWFGMARIDSEGRRDRNVLMALDPMGDIVWAMPTDLPLSGQPAIGADGTIYSVSSVLDWYRTPVASTVLAFDPNFGKKWEYPLESVVKDALVLSLQGVLYFSTSDGRLIALQASSGPPASGWPMFQHDPRHTGRAEFLPTIPARTDSITASQGIFTNRIEVKWKPVPEAQFYELWRAGTNDLAQAVLVTNKIAVTLQFDDAPSGDAERVHYYWVRAVNGAGKGPFSAAAEGFVGTTGPGSILWQTPLGSPIRAAPAVGAGNSIYARTEDGALHAVNARGAKQWSLALAPPSAADRPTAVVLDPDDSIFVVSGDNQLNAVGRGGERLWEFVSQGPLAPMPAVERDGTVLVVAESLYALAPDGSVRWKFGAFGGRFSPALSSEGVVYAISTVTQKLYALWPDGAVLWERDLEDVSAGPVMAPNGRAYAARGEWIEAFDTDGTPRILSTIRGWHETDAATFILVHSLLVSGSGTAYGTTLHGEVFMASGLGGGRAKAEIAHTASMALDQNGVIYHGATTGQFSAKIGIRSLLWTISSDGGFRSACTLTDDGTLYFGSENGTLFAVKAGVSPDTNGWPMLGGDVAHTGRSPGIGRVPDPPVGLRVWAGRDRHSVSLAWPSTDRAWRYRVRRSAVENPASAEVVATNLVATTFTDTDLPASTRFFYWIQAINPIGESEWSQLASLPVPALPPRPQAAQSAIDGTNEIVWKPVAAAAGYEIWRNTSNDLSTASKLADFVAGPRFNDPTAVAGERYFYWVRAVNQSGAGPFSDAAMRSVKASQPGDLIWSVSGPGRRVTRPEFDPAVAPDGTVYFVSDGSLFAVSSAGQTLWQSNLNGAVASSPSVDANGTVYVLTTNQNLCAVSPEGSVRWRYAFDSGVSSACPALGVDGTVFFCSGNTIHAVDANGRRRWVYRKMQATRNGSVSIDRFGSLYTLNYATVTALRSDGTAVWIRFLAAPLAEEGSLAIGGNGWIYGGARQEVAYAPDGQSQWQTGWSQLDQNGLGFSYGTPAISEDGRAYFGAPDGRMVCVDASGIEVWSFDLGARVFNSPSLGADGTVYAGTLAGVVIALSSDGKELWRFNAGNGLKIAVTLAPNQRLYAATANRFVALFTGIEPATNGWPMFQHDPQHSGNAAPWILPATPDPPSDLSATQGSLGQSVQLHWRSAARAASYEVWRGATRNPAAATRIATNVASTTAFLDRSVAGGATNYYWVRSINAAGPSNWSQAAAGFGRALAPGDILWEFNIDDGAPTGVALADDGAIVFGASNGRLYALDPSGREKWEVRVGTPMGTTPSIETNGMIHVVADGVLHSVGPDGTERYHFGPVSPPEYLPDFASVGPPAIGADGTLYFSLGGASVFALTRERALKWEHPAFTRAVIHPVCITRDGAILIVVSGKLIALNPDGTERWSWKLAWHDGAVLVPPSLGLEGSVFAAGEWWIAKLKPASEEQWYQGTGIGLTGAPVIAPDGTVFVNTLGFTLALNSDITKKWTRANSSDADGAYLLATADGSCIVGSSTGRISALDTSGKVQWSTQLEGSTQSTPMAIGRDGTVYVPSAAGKLYAIYGGTSPSEGIWPMYQHDARRTGRAGSDPRWPVPPAPGGISATEGRYAHRVHLTWQSAPYALSYEVWRGTNDNPAQALRVAQGISLSLVFDDESARAGSTNYYWVKAVNASGAGPFSASAVGYAREAYPSESYWESVIAPGQALRTPALAHDGTIYVESAGASPRLFALVPDGPVKWSYALGTNNSSLRPELMVGSDDTAYVADGSDLVAIGVDGIEKWRQNVGNVTGCGMALGAGDEVYFASDGGKLSAIKNGNALWATTFTGGTNGAFPVVGADGSIYLSANGSIFCVAANGKERWRLLRKPGPSMPLAIAPDGSIVAPLGESLVAVSARGEMLWETTGTNLFHSLAIGEGGRIVVAQSDRISGFSPEGRRLWSYSQFGQTPPPRVGPALDIAGWSYVPMVPSGLPFRNADGLIRRIFRLPDDEHFAFSAVSMSADGTLFAGSDNGRIVAVKPNAAAARSSWPMYLHDAQHTSRDQRPALQLSRNSGNGMWTIELKGELNTRYRVESSVDFKDWSPFADLATSATNRVVTISAPPNERQPRRFFRAHAD